MSSGCSRRYDGFPGGFEWPEGPGASQSSAKNAIHAATGKLVRSLPLKNLKLV